MKRIAMISVHTCPLAPLGGKETGGMNVYIRDLSRELTRRGHYVDVFTRRQNPKVAQVSHALGARARVIHIPAGPEEPMDKNLVLRHVPSLVEQTLSFAQTEGLSYDLIHSHYWLSGAAAIELRKAWQIPFVQMFHTLGHMKNSVAQSESEREGELRIAVETEVMERADHLIAATPMERAQMVWLYGADPHKISIVPCGVDINLFTPRPKAEARSALQLPATRPIILFVGRIEPLKGIDTLIRAVGLLSQDTTPPDERPLALIIGGGPQDVLPTNSQEMERLLILRESLGLTDQIIFLGSKPQTSLPLYYSAADVLVVPSHYESFGMVALEAMACGTPVIASKVGGLALVVQEGRTGYLVPDRNPEQLADRISAIFAQPELTREISQRAVEWARQFRWPVIAQRVLEVYEEMIMPATAAGRTKLVCRCE